jgi:hypothetical protein
MSMHRCLRREELSEDLRRAFSELSLAATRLKGAVERGDMFTKQRNMMELARINLDKARTALELHLADHNC